MTAVDMSRWGSWAEKDRRVVTGGNGAGEKIAAAAAHQREQQLECRPWLWGGEHQAQLLADAGKLRQRHAGTRNARGGTLPGDVQAV